MIMRQSLWLVINQITSILFYIFAFISSGNVMLSCVEYEHENIIEP